MRLWQTALHSLCPQTSLLTLFSLSSEYHCKQCVLQTSFLSATETLPELSLHRYKWANTVAGWESGSGSLT